MNLKEKYLKIALMAINEIEQQTSIEVNRLLERAHDAKVPVDINNILDCFYKIIAENRKEIKKKLKEFEEL